MVSFKRKYKADSCVRYNKAQHKNTGIPLEWIKDAGPNSSTDQPELVTSLIAKLVEGCDDKKRIMAGGC